MPAEDIDAIECGTAYSPLDSLFITTEQGIGETFYVKLGGLVSITEGDETEVSSVSSGFGLVNDGSDIIGFLTSVGTCIVDVFHINASENYYFIINCIDVNSIPDGSPLQLLNVSATEAIGNTYYVSSESVILIEHASYLISGYIINHRVASVSLTEHGLSIVNGNLIGQVSTGVIYNVAIESVSSSGSILGIAHCTIVGV